MGGEDHPGERLGPEAFRSLAEQSPDGIAILRSGRYVFASPAWAECLGASVDEIVRESFLDRVYPEDRVTIQQWLECPDDGSISEYRFSANGGRTRLLQLTRVRIPTEQGELLGLIGRDATHLKQTQAQLLLADRMMSIGALAAGTAHEINNPLTYVQGNLSFALDDLRALSDEVGADRVRDLVEALEEAEEGAERVRVIVRRLHAFARADQDEMQVVDVNRVVEDAVNMAFTEYRHRARLTKELAEDAFVRANGARLGQVLLNLLLNAAHALPEGEAEKNFIQVSTRVEDGQVYLAVRDSGPGIPPEIRGRVFDAFFTTKPVGIGTGLGLSIAHSVVTDLGGRIRVDSELGQGTTFEVVLPFSDPSAEADDEWGISGSVEAPARVLVIDDEPLITGALRRALRDHTVEVAASGRDAIELLRTREYDLVFCDLMMPEVTGMDVYAWAERERPGLERTFVLMTGGIFTPRAKAFLHSVQGKNRSVEKPFDMEKLRRFVSAFLQAQAASKTALSTGDI